MIKYSEKRLEKLRQALTYDAKKGVFTWNIDVYTGKGNRLLLIKRGTRAGCLQKEGYRTIRYQGKLYFEHKLAFIFAKNIIPIFIDHVDGNKQNNKINNLRECTREQNGQNRTKCLCNTSGFKGVCFHKKQKKYIAQIKINGVHHWLGTFINAKEAAKAYDKRAAIEFGKFANLNFKMKS